MRVDPTDIAQIEPYYGELFRAGIQRLLKSERLPGIVADNFPKVAQEEFVRFVGAIPDPTTFQQQVIVVAIKSLLKRTSDGFSFSGLEKHPGSQTRVYLSNHRDIICDPALFSTAVFLHDGRGTPEICLGDNLLVTPFVTDMVKVNKGITVKRGLTPRELLKWSAVLSTHIRNRVASGADSVWLAQREGRAKDGNDVTQPGVLKMLSLSHSGDLVDAVESLRLVPVAISYELDPCDALKARERLATSRQGSYTKAPGEDVQAMSLGIMGFKGRIHIAVGDELGAAYAEARAAASKKDQVSILAAHIDRQIHRIYRNWPSNYVACDLLEQNERHAGHYTVEEKRRFVERLEAQLDTVRPSAEDRPELRKLILQMYARSVQNQESAARA